MSTTLPRWHERCRPGVTRREEEDDTGEGQEGSGHFPPAEVRVRQPHPEREREHQAERAESLHDHERRPIEGRRLEDPSHGLRDRSREPNRLVQDLDQKPRIILAGFGLAVPFR